MARHRAGAADSGSPKRRSPLRLIIEPQAVCANADGLVYSIADSNSQQIVYIELIFPYRNFQISLLYSAMVLSEEKKPAFAMLTSIILRHFFWSS